MLSMAADRWSISFFYDKPDENFDIADLQCPAPGKCIAAGALDREGKLSPHAVVSTDSGLHWAAVPIPEVPISLFFLNANTAWLVAEKALWHSLDGGTTWKKLASERNIERVYFLDANRGFAVGDKGTLLETANGGVKWTAIRSLQGLTAQPGEIAFDWIFFNDPRNGVVIGEVVPQGGDRLPPWLDPQRFRGHSPRSTILVGRTSDGGASWKFSSIQRRDTLVDVRVAERALWFFFQPAGTGTESEIARCDWDSDSLVPLVSDSSSLLTDAVSSGKMIYVAAVARQGRLMEVPIPGKLRVFAGPDFDHMSPMAVDYRAVALATRFAIGSSGSPLLATDTGMILRLAWQPDK